MIELLALPQTTKIDELAASIRRPASGIPSNCLPGWESLPLGRKLPMLKCPNNEIVFSRNKIGRKLWKCAEFGMYDPNCYSVRIDYNPLHDPHLRRFYSKDMNLKRLREIGKITNKNDVICTLKDFNDYRRYLECLHTSLMSQEVRERENLRNNKIMFKKKMAASPFSKRNREDVLRMKAEQDKRRRVKFLKNLEQIKERILRHERIKQAIQIVLREKSRLQDVAINQKKQNAQDIERKRMLGLKKRLRIRDTQRVQRLNALSEAQYRQKRKIEENRWQRYLESHSQSQEKNSKLRELREESKARNIETHQGNMQKVWDKIQERLNKKRVGRREKTPLVRQELSDPESMQNGSTVYDSASYIREHIAPQVKRDLSVDLKAVEVLSKRVEALFDRLKSRTVEKAFKLINEKDKSPKTSKTSRKSFGAGDGKSLTKTVSFAALNEGDINWYLTSTSDLRSIHTRVPTPPSSLTSLIALVKENSEAEDDSSFQDIPSYDPKNRLPHLTKAERIFVEHFYIKFKKSLHVGVEQCVFEAVRVLRRNTPVNPKRELLEIDSNHLVKNVVKAILTYHLNPVNYDAALQLAVSFLSADIIDYLQKMTIKLEDNKQYLAEIQRKCRCVFK